MNSTPLPLPLAAHFVARVLGVELAQNGDFRLCRIAVLVAHPAARQGVVR